MPEKLSVHEAARSLSTGHGALQDAYCEISQLLNTWPKELNEYLYEETYNGVTAKTFLEQVVNALEVINQPYFQLTRDSLDLSSDLNRVGRGDGFRV